MVRFLLLTCLLFLGCIPLAGQINADSVLQLLATFPDDVAKERFLKESLEGVPIKAIDDPVRLYTESLAISKRIAGEQAEFHSILNLINIANFMGQFGLADSLSLHYVNRIKEVEAPEDKLELYHHAARASFYAQQYEQAIGYDSSALRLLPTVENGIQDSFAVDIYDFLAKSHTTSGGFIYGVNAINDGIERLLKKNPDPEKRSDFYTQKLSDFYTQLGVVYSQIGLYDRAQEYFSRTLTTSPNPGTRVMIQTNLGRNLLLTKQYGPALERYLYFFDVELPENERNSILPYACQGIIEAYYRLGNVDSLDYYFKLFSEFLADGSIAGNADNFLYRQSRFFHELAHGRLATAETIGQNLYQEAIAKNDPAERIMYTELLSELYRQRGDYRQADLYSQELLSLQDSIQSANRNDALLLYYNQFETKEKENQILLLGRERERADARRNQYQIAAGLLGLLLLTGFLFYLQLRKARRKLADQNEALNQLNATKDRFFGIIAHDLRNPIVALQTAEHQIETLYERGNTEGVKKTVGMISQTAAQLTGLLDNLLQWALGQAGTITLQKQTLALSETIHENLALYTPAAQAREVSLVNQVAENITINADYHALQTILRNLIGNAVKFSPSRQGATVTVAHRREGGMDLITVTDQGAGIPANEQANLFRLHRGAALDGRRKQGTGLGLILCKELTELHGGRIEVDAKVGAGTTFSVYLPE